MHKRAQPDTKRLEKVAVDLIAHKLQRDGLLVARPEFDTRAADLLVLANVDDDARVCRVQSKQRSLAVSKRARVEIPTRYVSDTLLVFLYVDPGRPSEGDLYCFFAADVTAWPAPKRTSYVLSLSRSTYRANLNQYLYTDSTPARIREVLSRSQPSRAFLEMFIPAPTRIERYPRATGLEVRYVPLSGGFEGSVPIFYDPSTGVESSGVPLLGDTSNLEYNPTTGSWSTLPGRLP